jgi:signal transduction histidine kinase
MTRSLKQRMLTDLGLWIVVAWCGWLGAVYLYTTYSQTSIWDDRLQSIAVKLLQVAPESTPSDAVIERRSHVAARDDELTFQVWTGTDKLLARTTQAPQRPLRPDFADGFANVDIDGEVWRVYSVSDAAGAVHVQVGSPRAMINADFRRHSLRAISMAAMPLALGGLLMWWSVRRALRPLAQIEATTRERSTFDLTPLPTDALPTEVLPLVQSFNRLLSQLAKGIESERRFIGDAAHELRTPLSALQAQLEVATRASSVEEKNAALGKLHAAVRRTTRLAEQLLDLARLDSGERVPIRERHELAEIVQHVVSEFEFSARRERRAIELAIEPCEILCDVDEIGILVRNLVDNALRYTLAGGKVRIACGRGNDGVATNVFLEVADDGPGVPVAEHAAIFERFHRATSSAAVRGSGIGLSLVARIARLHGAKITTGPGFGSPGLSVRVVFS